MVILFEGADSAPCYAYSIHVQQSTGALATSKNKEFLQNRAACPVSKKRSSGSSYWCTSWLELIRAANGGSIRLLRLLSRLKFST